MAVEARQDIENTYKTLRDQAGALEPESWSLVEVKGPDAVEFLQGQVTNDIEALEPGGGCYALLLNPKGRILADMRVLMRSPEELSVDGDAAAMEAVAANLKMYRIGRKVEVSQVPSEDRKLVSVIGPRARELAGIHPPPGENTFVEGELGGAKVLAIATYRGIDLLFDTSDGATAENVLSLDHVSQEVAEILRIEHGRPRFAVDMSDENLPGELGLEERAVSFTKGCYVGQEPVARMHHRGHPNRHLRGLELSLPAGRGEPVVARDGDTGGKAAGTITSAAVSPTFGPIALSVLRREIEPGTEVLIGEAPAKVVALPFQAG